MPMVRELSIHDTPDRLARAVADRFVRRLVERQTTGAVVHVCLTGGSTAALVHQAVAVHPDADAVRWNQVVFWWGDERYVTADDPDRNAGAARSALLDPVGASMTNEMPAADDHRDLEQAVRSYEVSLEDHGPRRFDIVMLGVGEDGHIASLFPSRAEVDVTDVAVVAVTDSPKPPPERISLTLPRLAATEAVWFLVSGAAKAGVVATALGAPTSTALPVQRLMRDSDAAEVVWFLDRAAADRIR